MFIKRHNLQSFAGNRGPAQAMRHLFNDVFGDDAEAIALELAQGASDPSDPPEMVAFLEELAAYERATFALDIQRGIDP